MKPATPQAARRIQEAREEGLSLWVQDKRTGGIVGYLLPTGELVRLANAGCLYARYLRALREGEGA
jgi:hypothetical protein